jgi:hypothetical protein
VPGSSSSVGTDGIGRLSARPERAGLAPSHSNLPNIGHRENVSMSVCVFVGVSVNMCTCLSVHGQASEERYLPCSVQCSTNNELGSRNGILACVCR